MSPSIPVDPVLSLAALKAQRNHLWRSLSEIEAWAMHATAPDTLLRAPEMLKKALDEFPRDPYAEDATGSDADGYRADCDYLWNALAEAEASAREAPPAWVGLHLRDMLRSAVQGFKPSGGVKGKRAAPRLQKAPSNN